LGVAGIKKNNGGKTRTNNPDPETGKKGFSLRGKKSDKGTLAGKNDGKGRRLVKNVKKNLLSKVPGNGEKKNSKFPEKTKTRKLAQRHGTMGLSHRGVHKRGVWIGGGSSESTGTCKDSPGKTPKC